jgi:hypothetical protein
VGAAAIGGNIPLQAARRHIRVSTRRNAPAVPRV